MTKKEKCFFKKKNSKEKNQQTKSISLAKKEQNELEK